jgi:hypothetical protein
VILSKFWSRYDLQNFRKRFFFGDDQGEFSKGTVVSVLGTTELLCVHCILEFDACQAEQLIAYPYQA